MSLNITQYQIKNLLDDLANRYEVDVEECQVIIRNDGCIQLEAGTDIDEVFLTWSDFTEFLTNHYDY